MKAFLVLAAAVAIAAMTWAASHAQTANPYRQPLKVTEYEVQAAAPPSPELSRRLRSLSPRGLRPEASEALESKALSAEVKVTVSNYLPRAVEPVLLVDGKQAGFLTGLTVINPAGDTVLNFTIPDAARVLREGSELAVQMGTQKGTRTFIEKQVRLEAVKPLDADTSERLNLPRNLR